MGVDPSDHVGPVRMVVEHVILDLGVVDEPQIAIRALMHCFVHESIVHRRRRRATGPLDPIGRDRG